MNDSQKKPWYKKWWAITLFIFIGIGILGSNNEKPATTPAQNPEVETEAPETATTVVFDLEALYGKSIDEIREVLGQPVDGEWTDPSDLQIEMGTNEWSNEFHKDDYVLLVTYSVDSRKVIDFFMSTTDPSGLTKDTAPLLEALNIQNSTHYTTDPVEALIDPSSYTGLIATPIQ